MWKCLCCINAIRPSHPRLKHPCLSLGQVITAQADRNRLTIVASKVEAKNIDKLK